MSKLIEVTADSCVYMGNAEAMLQQLLPSKRVIVISDTNIDRIHHHLISKYDTILIGQGEQAKGLTTLDGIYRRLIELGADRSTFILGIGGGIVTDITGFVASTYMRGVEFGFVTTTLLGAVDASVGGKNGINIGGFKNMVGLFSQPSFVVCDVALLHSLPIRDFRAGMAEVIKSAILGDAELFEILEHTTFEALREDVQLLENIVARCIQIKASVVAEDERESGRRRILNLGHTLAHAIEKCSTKMSHGEAVAVGLYHVTLFAIAQKLIDEAEGKRILLLIERYGFETDLPVENKQLHEAMQGDKKRQGDTLHIIIPTAIGAVEDRTVAYKELANVF